jgi:hypothetical protein
LTAAGRLLVEQQFPEPSMRSTIQPGRHGDETTIAQSLLMLGDPQRAAIETANHFMQPSPTSKRTRAKSTATRGKQRSGSVQAQQRPLLPAPAAAAFAEQQYAEQGGQQYSFDSRYAPYHSSTIPAPPYPAVASQISGPVPLQSTPVYHSLPPPPPMPANSLFAFIGDPASPFPSLQQIAHPFYTQPPILPPPQHGPHLPPPPSSHS